MGGEKTVSNKLHGQRGAILILTALTIIPLLGIAALSTDLGMSYLAHKEMQTAAELASLAAMKRFGSVASSTIDEDTAASVRAAAAETARRNQVRGSTDAVVVSTTPISHPENPEGDVMFGFYNYETEEFTVYSDEDLAREDVIVNAIQTRVRLAEGANPPFTFMLAGLMEHQFQVTDTDLLMTAMARATYGIVNVVIAFDGSASTDNSTMKPRADCPDSNYPYKQDRWFHNAARPDPDGACESGPFVGEPTIGPEDPLTDVVLPQPLTDWFRIARDYLLTNRLFKNLYRAGMIYYETTAYAPKTSRHVDVRLRAHSLNNKDQIETIINESIAGWESYARSTRTDPSLESLQQHWRNFPWPGGLFPPSSTYTNTGDAIRLGVKWITDANNETAISSVANVLVLFSDGLPNASRKPYSNPGEFIYKPDGTSDIYTSSDYYRWGAEWSEYNANLAKQANVVIHGVFYDNTGECSDSNPGFQHMKRLADITEGSASCASNMDNLREIFSGLSEKVNFYWVRDDVELGSSGHHHRHD